MIGVLSWCVAIVLSVMIYLITNRFLSQRFSGINNAGKALMAILLSAILTDFLIHIFIAIQSSYSEMMIWFSISFPFVGLCLIFINFIARAVLEWKSDRRS